MSMVRQRGTMRRRPCARVHVAEMEYAMAVSPPSQLNGAAKTSRPGALSIPDFTQAKARGQRLSVLTAYDYTMARLFESAGVDAILVGDSLGMVVQGHENS